MTLWPLILLAPAVLITALKGRSAWLWLSVALGMAVLWLAFAYVTWSRANGHMNTGLDWLFAPRRIDRAYHDTFYVVAHVQGLLPALVPCLVVGLALLIPGHPRRDSRDIALFWAAAVLWVFVTFAPDLIPAGGMPRRYVDYPDQISNWIGVVNLATTAAALATAFAALRPLAMCLRRRRATI